MSKTLHSSMSEAMRLTNEGRLAEATAAIQRTLGGSSAPVASEETGGTEGPVETTGGALEGATRPPKSAGFGRTGGTLRDALKPSRQYRGVPRLPDGLSSLPNTLPSLLDSLPGSLPNVLPGLPNGLPGLPDGLPGLPDGLPGPMKSAPGPAIAPPADIPATYTLPSAAPYSSMTWRVMPAIIAGSP